VTGTARHEYVLELPGAPTPPPRDSSVRHPVAEDAEALAQLMLDAYLGTIDYDGESIEDAREEIAGYLVRDPLIDMSWVRVGHEGVVSASLVAWWHDRECPLVSYVMTASAMKRRGLAAGLLARSVASLAQAAHHEVRAVITEGNTPSEIVFARAGFRRV
jgi:hypothetical protein